ncbi:uncharacterized protein PITG_07419 [Phytophthora infestans T30-4]|uniref:Uncharacterized protein n=1 Tax=Phytophthora infestans (strain T30-4) TaxID=403677 RepID=D0N8D0_PHYIT|nr:uncharacterized protein PITG_07419 [Phytophthora infestans T30-4]EEY53815.1 hypothetical protein PITG_07419 [Phytophthora infestans T30-4]|eukprot:XP_002904446.1 hypothetical protein PITG_07419 [Phytophthora infestans T30-4]
MPERPVQTLVASRAGDVPLVNTPERTHARRSLVPPPTPASRQTEQLHLRQQLELQQTQLQQQQQQLQL